MNMNMNRNRNMNRTKIRNVMNELWIWIRNMNIVWIGILGIYEELESMNRIRVKNVIPCEL